MPTRHNQGAFTLSELLIALTIITLLSSIALPDFTSLIQTTHINTLSDTLINQLSLAREHSILHQEDVEACGSSNGNSCDDHWDKGWIIYSPHTSKIFYQEQLDSAGIISWHGFSQRIRFHSDGTCPLGNGRFLICNRQNNVERQVVINRQGRLRPVQGLEPDQTPQLRCP